MAIGNINVIIYIIKWLTQKHKMSGIQLPFPYVLRPRENENTLRIRFLRGRVASKCCKPVIISVYKIVRRTSS